MKRLNRDTRTYFKPPTQSEAMDLPPMDRNAAQPQKAAELFAVTNAERARLAKRRKRQRAERKAMQGTRRKSPPIGVKFPDDDLHELFRLKEYAVIRPTLERIVTKQVRSLINVGEVWCGGFGGTRPRRCLANGGRVTEDDMDDCLSIGMQVAEDVLRKPPPTGWDGRGTLVGYVSQRVWFALSAYLEDSPQRSGVTTGMTQVPKEFQKLVRGTNLDAPVDRHANSSRGDYDAKAGDQAPAGIDGLTETMWQPDMFDRFDARNRWEISTGVPHLTAAIEKVRVREFRQVLKFFLPRGYDFKNSSSYMLKEYADRYGVKSTKTVLRQLLAALEAVRPFIEDTWPAWDRHFREVPNPRSKRSIRRTR